MRGVGLLGLWLWLWVDVGPAVPAILHRRGCTCSQLLGACHACHLQGAVVLLVKQAAGYS